MLLSRRYRNNWGYQIQIERREPIYQQYISRPNKNIYDHEFRSNSTNMIFDTLTHDDIQVPNAVAQNIIKHKYPGWKPGVGEDQQYASAQKLSQNVLGVLGSKGEQSGTGARDTVRKVKEAFKKGPKGAYTSQGATRIKNALGSVMYGRKKDTQWRPGFKGEMHLPGHSYCGPGTNIDIRLKRGDPGLNQLDRACKVHDIDYALAKTPGDVRAADRKFLSNIKKAKSGRYSHKKLIQTIFNAKMRKEDKGKLSHGKYAYDSANQPKMSSEELTKHRDAAQETIGEGAAGIDKLIGRRRKKDPARKLRKKMKKYKKPVNKAMRAALKRMRKRMLSS